MRQWIQTIVLSAGAAFGIVATGIALNQGVLGPSEYFVAEHIANATTSDPEVLNASTTDSVVSTWPAELATAEYDRRLLALVRYAPRLVEEVSTSTQWQNGTPTTIFSTSTRILNPPLYSSSTNVVVPGARWPAPAPYPYGGAILPFERIIAYYGNFYSRQMGILGEYPRAEVLARLASTSAAWEAADPDTPVRPAIHYIAMVAQADAGADGMYRAVMPDAHIEQAIEMAAEINGIVFLDLQIGLSTLERELPQFREFLARPEVHLGLDPEFAMKGGQRPGTVIGTFDAVDFNYAIDWLAEIVQEYQLPPKVLIIHRFTQNMVTNYDKIRVRPEVQVVMHMDGWGPRDLKQGTYDMIVAPEPVQFMGLKIFYKNDLKPPSTGIFTPAEALRRLSPQPIYIQYQ